MFLLAVLFAGPNLIADTAAFFLVLYLVKKLGNYYPTLLEKIFLSVATFFLFQITFYFIVWIPINIALASISDLYDYAAPFIYPMTQTLFLGLPVLLAVILIWKSRQPIAVNVPPIPTAQQRTMTSILLLVAVVILGIGIPVYSVYSANNYQKERDANMQQITDYLQSELAAVPDLRASFNCPNGHVISVYDAAATSSDQYIINEYSFVKGANGQILSTTTSTFGYIRGLHMFVPAHASSTAMTEELNTCKFTDGTWDGMQGLTFNEVLRAIEY